MSQHHLSTTFAFRKQIGETHDLAWVYCIISLQIWSDRLSAGNNDIVILLMRDIPLFIQV